MAARKLRKRTVSETREGTSNGAKKPLRLEDCWDEPDLPEKQEQTDLELLQGVWVSVSGRREAELLVSGSRYTVWFKDGSIYMGRFELSLSGQLSTMEMSIDEGPAHH